MLSFMSDELIWAIRREREEEARNLRPHTTPRPDPERTVHGPGSHGDTPLWVAPALKANAGAR